MLRTWPSTVRSEVKSRLPICFGNRELMIAIAESAEELG
jgi:hypothetical protein